MRPLLIAALLILSAGLSSKAQNWTWAKGIGDSLLENGSAVATDASGNIYVAGEFRSLSLTIDSITLTNAGVADIFIVKFDPNGNVIWATSIGDSAVEQATAIVCDDSGFVYLTGYFLSDSLSFGVDTLGNTGGNDIFLCKLDTAGNMQWVRGVNGDSNDNPYSLSIDGNGDIIVAGSSVSSFMMFGVTSFLLAGDYDIFVAKYDKDGNFLWAKVFGGVEADYCYSVATDHHSNIYLAGNFYSDSLQAGNWLHSHGGTDIVLIKIDSSGSSIQSQSFGGPGLDFADALVCDASGNIITGGPYTSTSISFGSSVINNTSTVQYDSYVLKTDSAFGVLWAKNIGGSATEFLQNIAVSPGEIYVSGYFSSALLQIDSLHTLSNSGNDDSFFCKYDENGNVVWAKKPDGNFVDRPSAIAADPAGNLIICGHFSNTLIFDSIPLSANGAIDMYIAKLDDLIIPVEEINSGSDRSFVFPNPAGSYATVSCPKSFIGGTLEIYDATGKQILAVRMISNQYTLNTSGMTPGIYFYRISSDDQGTFSGKFIAR